MGGLQRLNPFVIPQKDRRSFSCTTVGCPDQAVIILPLNLHVHHRYEEVVNRGQYTPLWVMRDAGVEAKTLQGNVIEMRLCFRCIRTLATALPPGMRLEGARLRYPEIAPLVMSADEILDSPEFIERWIHSAQIDKVR